MYSTVKIHLNYNINSAIRTCPYTCTYIMTNKRAIIIRFHHDMIYYHQIARHLTTSVIHTTEPHSKHHTAPHTNHTIQPSIPLKSMIPDELSDITIQSNELMALLIKLHKLPMDERMQYRSDVLRRSNQLLKYKLPLPNYNTIIECNHLVNANRMIIDVYHKRLVRYNMISSLSQNATLRLVQALIKSGSTTLNELTNICNTVLSQHPYSTPIYNALIESFMAYKQYDQCRQLIDVMIESHKLDDVTKHIRCNNHTFKLLKQIARDSHDRALLDHIINIRTTKQSMSKTISRLQPHHGYSYLHSRAVLDAAHNDFTKIDDLSRESTLPVQLQYTIMKLYMTSGRCADVLRMWQHMSTQQFDTLSTNQQIEVYTVIYQNIRNHTDIELYQYITQQCTPKHILHDTKLCNAAIRAACRCNDKVQLDKLMDICVQHNIKLSHKTHSLLIDICSTVDELDQLIESLPNNIMSAHVKFRLRASKLARLQDWSGVYQYIDTNHSLLHSTLYTALLQECTIQHNLHMIEVIQNHMDQHNYKLQLDDYIALIAIYSNAGDKTHIQYAVRVHRDMLQYQYRLPVSLARNIIHCYAQCNMYHSAINEMQLQQSIPSTNTVLPDIKHNNIWLICDVMYACLHSNQLQDAIDIQNDNMQALYDYSIANVTDTASDHITPLYMSYFLLFDGLVLSGHALTLSRHNTEQSYNLTSNDSIALFRKNGITLYNNMQSSSTNHLSNDTTQMSSQHVHIARTLMRQASLVDPQIAVQHALYNDISIQLNDKQYNEFLIYFSNHMHTMRNKINGTTSNTGSISSLLEATVKRLIQGAA